MLSKTLTLVAVAGCLQRVANGLDVIQPFFTAEYLEEVKALATTWTPFEYESFPFKGEDIRKRMGLILPSDPAISLGHKNPVISTLLNTFKYYFGLEVTEHNKETLFAPVYRNEEIALQQAIPVSFDWRSQDPTCIHSVRDQGGCGSCWAFSSTGMLEDRFCIATNGLVNVRLSPEDMVACNVNNGGCKGGLLTETINYFITEGVVSDDCRPYKSGIGTNGFCKFSCDDYTLEDKKYLCQDGSLAMPHSYTEI